MNANAELATVAQNLGFQLQTIWEEKSSGKT